LKEGTNMDLILVQIESISQYIAFAIFCIIGIVLLIGIIKLLSTVRNYFLILTSLRKNDLCNDFQNEIETTNSLRALIKEEVVEEIQYILKDSLYVDGSSYNRLKFDEDVNTITKNVYSRINPKLLLLIENNFVVHTKDYWITYIHHQTAVAMLQLLKSGTIL
jgi:hypothetical protein